MIGHGDEIGIERRRLGSARSVSAQHAQRVGGVRQARFRSDRFETAGPPHRGGGEHGGCGQQRHRRAGVLAIRDQRSPGAQGLDGRQPRRKRRAQHDREDRGPRRTEDRLQFRSLGQPGQEPAEHQGDHLLEGHTPRQIIEAAAADHQTAGDAIDVGQGGVGGNDVFKTIGHGLDSFKARP